MDYYATGDSPNGFFSIIGLWGQTIGEVKNVQTGDAGDYICQNETDATDIYIVKRKIFENTYLIK